jgi:predicted RNA-binding protein with PUA-like domain
MARWLLKTEPEDYDFSTLMRERRTSWDGITAAPALHKVRQAKKGDEVVIYHTGDERQVIGLGKVSSDPAGDPPVFEVTAGKALPRPVTLAALKQEKAFAGSALVKQGRLSVVPLDDAQWKVIMRLGGL